VGGCVMGCCAAQAVLEFTQQSGRHEAPQEQDAGSLRVPVLIVSEWLSSQQEGKQ
jgi:hypothetical protein